MWICIWMICCVEENIEEVVGYYVFCLMNYMFIILGRL